MHRMSARFRAMAATNVLARPPEYAMRRGSTPRTALAIAASIRRRYARSPRAAVMGSRDVERGLASEETRQRDLEVRLPNADLLLGVPLADGHALAFRRLVVDCHAERRAALVHARVAPADRCGVVVEGGEALPQGRKQGLRAFRESVLVHEREHADRDGREPRRQGGGHPLAPPE